MTDLFFWKNWPRPYRLLYLFLLASSSVALVIYTIQLLIGVDAIISWTINQQLQSIPVQVDTFFKSIFKLDVEIQNFFITEQFIALPIEVNKGASNIFLGFLVIGSLFLLSVIPELPRFWYIASMGIFILLLASFKLDLLQIFGLRNNTVFIATVVLYAGISYYFHAFNTNVTIPVRLISFSLLTVLLGIVIIFFSRTTYPFISITGNGIIIPIVLSIAFIIMVSHEIMSGFLYLVTQSGGIGGRNSLLHFSLISLIYLVNIGMLYARNTGLLTFDIFYINAFYLYLISLVLGIWGFKKRNVLFQNLISFYPNGAFVYLALAIISTATIGFFFATGNDSMIEMLEDIIVFSHLAMGVSFLFYVFMNFRALMKQNLPVYKVVYQAKIYPFFIARGVGLLIMLALFFRSNMYPLYQSIAGYNNVIGDVYAAQQENVLAEQYYKLGIQYDFQNHKSNYAIASLARLREDDLAAIYYLKQSLLKNPSDYAFGSLSDMYLDRGLFFEALFNLQAGVKVFPKSGELCNNLALLYDRSNISDSAFIYHKLANQLMDNRQETAQTNLTAFWIRNNNLVNADSLLRETAEERYIPLQANRLVLSNLNNIQSADFVAPSISEDSLLSNSQFAYLFNYTANRKTTYDSTLAGFYTRFSKKEENTGFNENLRFAEACYEYYNNDRAQGFESVVGLSVNSPLRSTYFSKIAGLWFLQQNAPNRAVEFFTQAIQAGDTSVTMRTYEAFALSEAGEWLEALAAWRELLMSTDVNTRTLAKTMETISGAILAGQPAFAAKSLDDSGKALLIHFSKNILLPDIPVTITNTQYRVQALAQLAERCIEIDSLARAEELLAIAKNTNSLGQALQYRLNAVSLKLMLAKGQYQSLLTAIDSLSISEEHKDKKLYWQAVSYEQTKNYKRASLFYKQALKRLPVNTDVVQKASQFYEIVQKNPELAYNTLLEATRLNPFDVVLQKEYILQCLDLQLLAYAENAMNNLREITSETDYQSFLPLYESRRTSVEKQVYDWK